MQEAAEATRCVNAACEETKFIGVPSRFDRSAPFEGLILISQTHARRWRFIIEQEVPARHDASVSAIGATMCDQALCRWRLRRYIAARTVNAAVANTVVESKGLVTITVIV